MSAPHVAFVCVHNACRSQIAQALGTLLAADVFVSYSAGTEIRPQIDPTAVRLVQELYGVDMQATQYSKRIDDLPPVDVVVTMGCGVSCPTLPCKHREDWGLEDPTGQPDEVYLRVIRQIEADVLDLKARIGQSDGPVGHPVPPRG